jgi:uncharacterized membrane protein HdeD (DUF308 family)
MIGAMTKNWWVVLLRGLAAILFGFLAYSFPAGSIVVLVMLFGAYALFDGVLELVVGMKTKVGSLILVGIVGIAAGLFAFFRPGLTAISLLYVIAFWAILAGILQIVAAVRLRKDIADEWFWILSGVLTVLLGCVLVARPGAGALSIVWLIATLAILWGILLVVLAFKLKGLHGRVTATA